MKFAKIAAAALGIAVLTSCSQGFLGHIKTDVASTSEIVLTPQLKDLLKATPQPKIVIRVVNPPKAVTEADRFNSYINEIEKVFVQKGYTVRDRALLENVMGAGNVDYQAIKTKIDTDLIIDILALNFEATFPARRFFNKTTQKEENFATDQTYVDCQMATLECRVTIVDRGQLGGLFTLKISPCDFQSPDFFIDGFRQTMAWTNQKGSPMFPVLRMVIESENDKRQFTRALGLKLIGLLSGA